MYQSSAIGATLPILLFTFAIFTYIIRLEVIAFADSLIQFFNIRKTRYKPGRTSLSLLAVEDQFLLLMRFFDELGRTVILIRYASTVDDLILRGRLFRKEGHFLEIPYLTIFVISPEN